MSQRDHTQYQGTKLKWPYRYRYVILPFKVYLVPAELIEGKTYHEYATLDFDDGCIIELDEDHVYQWEGGEEYMDCEIYDKKEGSI